MKTKQTAKPPARKRTATAAKPRSAAQQPDAAQPDAPPDVDPPAMRIEQWPVARLKPYERNPRRNDSAIPQMVASIKEFGFAIPVLAQASDGLVIDGHLRLKAAVAMGLASVPVIPCDGWTEAQVKAFRLMVNRSVLWADWDPEALALEFAELKALEFDLTLTGFDQKELVSFMAGTANAAEDDVPDVPETPVSRAGDLWLLGGHRLLCGDSTNAADVERLMAGAKADMVFTDPPYGVNFKRGKFVGRSKQAKGPVFPAIENDELKGDELRDFIAAALGCAFAVCNDAPIYVWSPSLAEGLAILSGVTAAGFKVQSQIIWNKRPFVIGRADYHWKHEVCWYGFKGEHHPWYGGRDQGTVWDVPKPQIMDLHPTMKPVELGRIAIQNSSKDGDIVLDLFGGSGSTLIGCENAARSAFLLEIAPAYCDVIVARWQTLTSKDATLETDGRTFAAIAAERVPVNTSRPIKGKRA